jgi:hypothetical protein
VPLMVHAGSLGGRPRYSFITEFTFKNVSHVNNIASTTFKMEENHLEIFINSKYKSPNCTLLIWSLRGCTRKCSVFCSVKQGQNFEKRCPKQRMYVHQKMRSRGSESVLCYRYIIP